MVRERIQVQRLHQLGRSSCLKVQVALQQRPALRTEMYGWLKPVAEGLTIRLGAPVAIEAELMGAAIQGSDSLRFPGAFVVIALDQLGEVALLELDPALVAAWVDRLAGGEGVLGAPTPLSEAEEAGLSLLVLEVLEALRSSPLESKVAPRLTRVVLSAAEASALCELRKKMLAVRLSLNCGGTFGSARLLVPAAAVRVLAEQCEPTFAALADRVAGAGVSFRVMAGHSQLGEGDWVNLRQNDVILLDGLRHEGNAWCGPTRLRGPSFELVGELGPSGFVLQTVLPQEKRTMNDQTQVTRGPMLPVEIEVELTRARLTIAELGQLQPGGLISLGVKVGEPVTLKVGDVAVATAELVEIEGEIGARILRMLK
jgi:type III secretion protein Q